MSATPGSAEYYRQQVEASKKTDQQRAQEQAQQQVNYEAYQAANKQAQQKAIQTGQPQTLTSSDIQAQRQSILDTKYVNPVESTPDQKVYSIPLTGVDQAAQARNYANYQQANKQAQQQSLAQDRAALLGQNYELFKQNQIFGNPGQDTAYGRANVRYEVNLGNNPTHYFVGLYEGGRPEKYGPANPFESPRTREARIATSATNPNFFESMTAGYEVYFENIKETLRTGGGATGKANYAPEVEGALIGAVMQGMKDQPTGINTLAQIGREIAENPGYAVGSIGASIGFTFGTAFIGKGVTGARALVGGIRAFRAADEIGQIAEVGANQVGVKNVATQAIKVGKTGAEIPLKQGPFGIYTESVSKAGIRASKPAVPDFFRIETRAIGNVVDKEGVITSLEDVGYSSAKTGKTSVFSGVLDEKSVGKFLEPEAGKPAASTYTEVAQNESSILPKADAGIFTGKGSQTTYSSIVKVTGGSKVSEPVSVGGVLDYSNKELANFVKPQGAAAAKSIGKVGESPFSGGPGITSTGKSGSSSILGTISKQDKALLKNAALKDIGVFSGQAATKGESSVFPGMVGSAAKALGGFSGYANRQKGSNESGVSLGFGGATGAERKARKSVVEELTQSFTPKPDTSSKSTLESLTKALGDVSTGSRSKSQNVSITSELTKGLDDLMPKQGQSLNSLFSQESSQGSRSSSMTETAAIAGLSSSLLPGLSTSQKSIFKLNIPIKSIPTPNEPSFFNFNLPGFGESKKSKRRKKKGSLYGEGAFKKSDIVANSVSKQIANILDNAIGKVE